MAQKDDAYIALDSAVGQIKDVEYVIAKGKRYRGNHPMVKHAPELFEKGSAFDGEIEMATAGPGEKRA